MVEYTYDVFDRRIGRKIDTSAPFDMANAVIERYVLDDIHNGLASADGGNVVLDFVDPDGSGAQAIAMSKRYLYGEAVDQLFAQEDLSKTLGDAARNLWPLVDHLGTVRDLAKQDGTIAAHYKYDSFGNVTSGDTSKTRYLFTSREFDTATKLQYNRARYYDAAVGRWISEDPLGFAAGDANVGRYVGNRPTGATDPSGLDRRIMCFGHMWLLVDTYNSSGNKKGQLELSFDPWRGFAVSRFGDCPYPNWTWGTHKSNQLQDEQLIALWRELQKDWLSGRIHYTGVYNCWGPVLQFSHYGGAGGPVDDPIIPVSGPLPGGRYTYGR